MWDRRKRRVCVCVWIQYYSLPWAPSGSSTWLEWHPQREQHCDRDSGSGSPLAPCLARRDIKINPLNNFSWLSEQTVVCKIDVVTQQGMFESTFYIFLNMSLNCGCWATAAVTQYIKWSLNNLDYRNASIEPQKFDPSNSWNNLKWSLSLLDRPVTWPLWAGFFVVSWGSAGAWIITWLCTHSC